MAKHRPTKPQDRSLKSGGCSPHFEYIFKNMFRNTKILILRTISCTQAVPKEQLSFSACENYREYYAY